MPELPEVETIKRDLEEVILGKKITEVCVHNPKIIREPGLAAFRKGLAGAIIKKILRKAKVLILELSNGKSLVAHLKMTGQLIYPGGGKNSRVAFHLSDGKILDFNDQRLFAELRLLDDWRSLKFIQGLGPEPADVSLRRFKEMLAKKRTAIKPLLMEQTFISGIGNIYAAEILFQAKIRPERRANELKDKEKELLFKAINDILNAAIRHAGSSVDDYVRVSGTQGGYVKYHKVYDRQGKPCSVCKATIKKISQGGRGTYFCPRCQK
ncbi:MAG: bifunctional DNA-formamidopyrimidine glycosylase/DNA-(apurinic or apyrimidinic site) lyase [Candidatus Omnitrophota bacterium]|jgi:formamidopyrimidine-DNA glycosylase|nr:bifunctional DNA-formamidopyrimidine glycosylase/DNA-(apurinic or apyrimidinic site) lyase [Candidatus Omnitrophota bacterium]MDD5517764.1 bifunctional DNA-formamidopyrimidine glycosylase/DNA-(apurinic or apyrimidinic site) lyase [Candidatus Omnitrophota bacterium]